MLPPTDLALVDPCRKERGEITQVGETKATEKGRVRSMPVPGSNLVQFVPTGGEFFVDVITDPGGAPASILDVDQGFEVTGRVTLPNWLKGKGQVCVYADELGGPIDEKLSPCAKIDIKGKEGEPGTTDYKWSIKFPGTVLPDPSPGSQLYRLAAIFQFGDQATDIASFVEMGTYLVN
jgi:hypothetical protein